MRAWIARALDRSVQTACSGALRQSFGRSRHRMFKYPIPSVGTVTPLPADAGLQHLQPVDKHVVANSLVGHGEVAGRDEWFDLRW